jgi:DNA invertase Pin-like site-specific DNA recombinase
MNVNITDMARAYSYIRFSTPEQAEGDSLRRQTELSEEYAKKHKLVFDRSLNLKDEGLSAFSGANRTKGALAVFLKAVETGIVKPGSYLLVESLDRLSRDTLSAQMTLFMELINAGITVVTLADEQIYSKATIDADISKLMLSLVIMMRSHEESLMKSRRLVAAWTKKRRDIHSEKLTSVCPHWLKLNADRKSFHVVEERAKVLRRIFQMAIDGVGQASIARKLNEEKVPTWGRNDGWHLAYIHSLLRNRAVLGEFQPRRRILRGKRQYIEADDAIKDYYPRIIDEMTWQKVQARKQTSAPGRVGQSRGNLFSRIAFDGYSGSPMRHIGRGYDKRLRELNGPESYRHYYLVSDYQRKNPKAKAVSWRYNWFEKYFLDYITGLDWQAITKENIPIEEIGAQKQLEVLQTRIDDLDVKLNRLKRLAHSTDNPPETLVEDMNGFEADKKAYVEKAREALKSLEAIAFRRAALIDASTEFKDLIAKGDPQARLRLREEIRRRINRIDIFPNGADAIHLKDEPVTAPGMPAFKITFSNGAIRWVFCNSRKPENDAAAILDTGVPPADMELILRERPETTYDTANESHKQSAPPRAKVLVPVFVPKNSIRPDHSLRRPSRRRPRKK